MTETALTSDGGYEERREAVAPQIQREILRVELLKN